MLFIQRIDQIYTKNERYPKYANMRRAERFLPIEYDGEIGGEVLFHSANKVKIYGAEAFSPDKLYDARYGNRIAVTKDGDSYSVLYRGADGRYKSKFTLEKGEYGRLMYNDRIAGEDIWFYHIYIYNFVNADSSAFKSKLFYKKIPDREFTDMKYLRYS